MSICPHEQIYVYLSTWTDLCLPVYMNEMFVHLSTQVIVCWFTSIYSYFSSRATREVHIILDSYAPVCTSPLTANSSLMCVGRKRVGRLLHGRDVAQLQKQSRTQTAPGSFNEAGSLHLHDTSWGHWIQSSQRNGQRILVLSKPGLRKHLVTIY